MGRAKSKASGDQLEFLTRDALGTGRAALRAVQRSRTLAAGDRGFDAADPVGHATGSTQRELRHALQAAEARIAALCNKLALLAGASSGEASVNGTNEDHSYIRRMAALFAWIDEEHAFSADTVSDELPFFVDPVHLDAYAETLDAGDWRTITRPDGRAFYVHMAHEVIAALRTQLTDDHVGRVRALKAAWDA